MAVLSRLTRTYALLFGSSATTAKLLDSRAWSLALRGERARVDRNGSPLGILSISLPSALLAGRPLELLADFLAERLRLTDTPGWQDARRLGVLLPDTPQAGAEKVAADILDFLGDRHGPVAIKVAIYPDGDAASHPELEETVVDLPVGQLSIQTQRSDALLAQRLPIWKRAMDLCGASLGLLVFGPVILCLAAAVSATSRGGAFYLQEREGLGGRRFKMFKLRTMIADSDALKAKLRRHSVQDGPAFKMVRDPRVTPIGRFLRSTSLDELPQLINVLLGHMSLVGPRPLPVEESLGCTPWQRRRLEVTPGITCIWQVRGRSTVSFDEWMRMDLQYAERRSPWLDTWLIACTPPALLLTRGPR